VCVCVCIDIAGLEEASEFVPVFCLSTYMCVYMCMYVCIYVYVCVYICVCMCLYLCMYVCIYVYVCVYICVYKCVCVHTMTIWRLHLRNADTSALFLFLSVFPFWR